MIKTNEEVWNDYKKLFDFGDTESYAKECQIKYDEKRIEDAIIDIECEIIIKNYYFITNEFNKVYKEILFKRARNNKSMISDPVTKETINVPRKLWENKTSKDVFKILKDNGFKIAVIAYILVNELNENRKHTGIIIKGHCESKKKAADTYYHKAIRGYMSEVDKKFIITYIDDK